MRQSFDRLTFLTGSAEELENLPNIKALPVFSEQSVDFLTALSKELLADSRTKQYPDLSAYAFWIRKASLAKMREKYEGCGRMGRGVSFHIAPSNVPVAFAMSFTAGLLAGNACIVRVSNKEHAQVDIIVRALRRLFDGEFREMAPYLHLVRYAHDAEITQALSDLCDVRVIWGGNRTISTIRAAALPPRAIELTFADRYSLAVIDADRYLEADTKKVADAFYLDTYYSDQAACSSPRLVFWLGKRIDEAQERFWGALDELVREKYALQSVQCVDKLDAFCRLAVRHPDIRRSGDGLLTRVTVPELYSDLMEHKENGGYFFEYRANALEELAALLKKPCQSIGYFGVAPEDIRQVVLANGVRGADRIVPLGQTMELSLIWDGFDLVESMSRIVETR